MTDARDPNAGPAKAAPRWALIAGFGIGASTLIFLMGLVGLSIAGYPIPCGNTFPIMLLFGLCLGLSSAFLGGYAAATGDIKLPVLGDNPISTAVGGGILFLIIGVAISWLVITNNCDVPAEERSSLIRGKIVNIPGDIEVRPESDEFFYNDRNSLNIRCKNKVRKLPDGGTEETQKCDGKYDIVFAVDTRDSQHDEATISFVKRGSELEKKVCQIRLLVGDPSPETGERAHPAMDGIIDYDNQYWHVKFHMVYATSPRVAETSNLLCFKVSFPGSGMPTQPYSVRVTPEGAEAYPLGIRGRSVTFVGPAEAASANKAIHGAMARFMGSLGTPKSPTRVAKDGPVMPTLRLDPVADLENDNPVIREAARRALIRGFSHYKENIWENLTDSASPIKQAALINVVTSALRPATFSYRDLSAELRDVPPEKLKLIVNLAITSESAHVRAEARRFMRTFPYDSVESEFQIAFGVLVVPSGCLVENLQKCHQGAFAGNYLYYNRLANIMLHGRNNITPEDFSSAGFEFEKVSKLRPSLSPAAQIDFISPLFAFNQIVLWGEFWGEKQPTLVPDAFKGHYSSAKFSSEIVNLAANSDDYYPYPFHIYSALAAIKNKASYFEDVLKATGYGSKVINYPPGPGSDVELKANINVYSGPDVKQYSHDKVRQVRKAKVLSQFGDWYFYKIISESGPADFGWVKGLV